MDFNLCGLRVSSALALEELPIWAGEDRPADITIRFGAVPPPTADAWSGGPVMHVRNDGACRLTLKAVGAYLIRNGNEIIIDPVVPRDTPDLALFLLSTGLGVLCHQRGLLPLHASCVTFGGPAIAFAAESGVGKSTIAAVLLQLGAKLVADDVTVIDTRAPGGPVVLPSYPRQKLWRDTLSALHIAPGAALRVTAPLEKYNQPVDQAFHPTPIRLGRIVSTYRYRSTPGAELSPLHGVTGFDVIQEHIYRFSCAVRMGYDKALFAQVATLADQVPQSRLILRHGLSNTISQIRELRDHLAGETP